jgi:hypothetical protein
VKYIISNYSIFKLLVVIPAFFILTTAEALQRTPAEVSEEITWAAKKDASYVKEKGMQKLVVEIKRCYSQTPAPAFKCVYLDLGAWHLDTSFAKAAGIPHGNEYFDEEKINERLSEQMSAANIDQDTAQQYISNIIVAMSKAVDYELNEILENDDKIGNVFNTTPEQLHVAYDNNEVLADNEMRDKIIRITGKIKSIDKNINDDVVLVMQAGDDFSHVQLRLMESQRSIAATLNRGQSVTIECQKMRRILGSPFGSNCKVVPK